MSGTQPKSQLFSIKAWEELSYLLPDESKLSVYYLEKLWGDEGFHQAWTRLQESCAAKWKGRVQEMAQQAQEGDLSLLKECGAELAQSVSELAKTYPLPFRVRFLLSYLVVIKWLELVDTPLLLQCVGVLMLRPESEFVQISKLGTLLDLSKSLQLLPSLDLPAQLGVSLLAWELAFLKLDELPLVSLPLPLRSEPEKSYVKRVKGLLRTDSRLLKEFVERFRLEGSRFRFSNPRNAIPAILALAKDYYEKCRTRASNRNDKKLMRYATQVYLRVVKGWSWGQIATYLNLKRAAVSNTTKKAMKMLGITPKSVRTDG